ncbi:MAG: putative sulfate exporter family transporter [Chloroflexi bacterium]|nr:putative sulfate exporter family transporter [Chloroflexota bacterium]
MVVAISSRILHDLIPNAMLTKAISEILIAMLLGLLIRNTIRLPASVDAGAKFALDRILRFGIILLGLRLSLQDVAATGSTALVLIVVCISFALGFAFLVGRGLNIPRRLVTLIGFGTAICGNSAIVATAPLIEAKEEDVSFAVAMITLFGLIAVIVYPIVGHALALSDSVFGLWSGTAVNDTSQVVATAAAYSPRALDIATVVKLTRNVFLGPLMILMGFVYARATHHATKRLTMQPVIPWFVVAFIVMSLLRTLGIAAGILPQNVDQPEHLFVSAAWLKLADDASKFAILCALTGIGLSTNIASLRQTGWRPFILALTIAFALAVASLAMILMTGLGA